MRDKTSTIQYVNRVCSEHGRSPKEMYKLGQRVLEYYRTIRWQMQHQVSAVTNDIAQTGCGELDEAFTFLENFAPDNVKIRIDSEVSGLFRLRLYMEVLEGSLTAVKDFPGKGSGYYSIIDQCYLQDNLLTNAEMSRRQNISESTFYDHKREAVLLFSISFLFVILPAIDSIIYQLKEEMNEKPQVVTGFVEHVHRAPLQAQAM